MPAMYGNDDARMHGAVLQIITAVKSHPSAMSNTADAPHHPPSAAMELMSGYDACTERTTMKSSTSANAVYRRAPTPAQLPHHLLGVVDGERVVEAHAPKGIILISWLPVMSQVHNYLALSQVKILTTLNM